ncbi:hypothetical protein KM043_007058 [Ampulex compressa]|nr:hypothetical protein KM043_007058 [Ampulex compressa]
MSTGSTSSAAKALDKRRRETISQTPKQRESNPAKSKKGDAKGPPRIYIGARRSIEKKYRLATRTKLSSTISRDFFFEISRKGTLRKGLSSKADVPPGLYVSFALENGFPR